MAVFADDGVFGQLQSPFGDELVVWNVHIKLCGRVIDGDRAVGAADRAEILRDQVGERRRDVDGLTAPVIAYGSYVPPLRGLAKAWQKTPERDSGYRKD